ncbi:uncharacterized protein [Halyomorpha halys]|uniref:uncharacterized protein n=1 Tax=Halyomorpha halys TaxID=286706 RepID=UPI0006D4DF35|nr:uncharacterized protein LOC106689214 [Halyomorpha halys]
MNKSMLILIACVLLMVDGQQELRKEGRDFSQSQQLSSQLQTISNGTRENVPLEREKRMPDDKKTDDGSFGYAWNVGNGVSYMKIHVGKTSNPVGTDSFAAAQHEVISSLRDSGHSYLQNQNDKTDFENLHKNFLKTSQHIASQKNKNFIVKPTIGDLNTHVIGKQELNEFNKEQNKGHTKFEEFKIKPKHHYDNLNQKAKFSGWPQDQSQSLKELKYPYFNVKSQYEGGEAQGIVKNKPANGFEYSQVFFKNIRKPENFEFSENLDVKYGSIELPNQESSIRGNNFYIKGKESHSQEVSEQNGEGRAASTNPMIVNSYQKHSSGVNDAVFKYIGEAIHKTEGDEKQTIPIEFSKSQDEALSTPSLVSSHQSYIEEVDQKQDFDEIGKTINRYNLQKTVSGTPQTLQTEKGNVESKFRMNHESNGDENIHPQIGNGFTTGYLNEMHPAMNQKLINDQVERIKQMQQKIIESHFPGAGIYDALDGNTQHGFQIQGHPMNTHENLGLWKQDDHNREDEQTSPSLAQTLQKNRDVINSNYQKERPVYNGGNPKLSFSNIRQGYLIGDSKMHRPLMNNNDPSHKFRQNDYFGGYKIANEESEGYGRRQTETLWRPQRYSLKSTNQHHSDYRNETYRESNQNKDIFIKNDERKGREIKHESIDLTDLKETHAVDDHSKEHSYETEELEEAKTKHGGNRYHNFQKYSSQEPQVRVITKAVPVHKELKIPVPQMVRHPILIPVPVKVLEPYPIKIPVPVTIEKTVEVPVEKVIHYPVEKLVPKKVVKEVRVPVPKPYPVKVPVYKIKYVHHNKKKHE